MLTYTLPLPSLPTELLALIERIEGELDYNPDPAATNPIFPVVEITINPNTDAFKPVSHPIFDPDETPNYPPGTDLETPKRLEILRILIGYYARLQSDPKAVEVAELKDVRGNVVGAAKVILA